MNLIFILLTFILQLLIPVQETGQIELQISNTRSNRGIIRVLIFRDSDGFPEERSKAFQALSLPVLDLKKKHSINELPPGKYALSIFHDEDENGEMRKNSLGYPLEKYGFSNNPKVLFSIPSFEKCAVQVGKGETKLLKIELR
ncbi:DUF2141 domain-containing protein [Algoriphagus sp. CAU 1675]|uniref:DUF2141 domain-containing protein n=1 Tax=Algoriphagus sp. CAU 1675 TaxID=3032597 RepID=UPI0023DBF471|nr:DUF2141 domain-containing protein [Algoriphagus sp. CAU 1675]MDF2158299.1 DUF2141 domain-containing protein [Algoriphagus sp. CAU 1675]